jgi:hypothetical protein
VTEVADQPDPLVVRAFTSDELTQTARKVAQALGVDDSWIARIGDPFVLLVDEEGIWLCPDDSDQEPYVSIGWPIIGKLRDSWGPRGGKAEAVAGVVFTIVTAGQLGPAGRQTVSVLCAPIQSGSDLVELRVPVDSIDGIARDAEKRRPRTSWGPMLPWVPD